MIAKIKPKVSKEELQELAGQTIVKLALENEEYRGQINLLEARIEDNERKIRWLKRELME
jgi:hypothetical protein